MLGEEFEVSSTTKRAKKNRKRGEEDDFEVPVRTGSISRSKTGRDKPEVPGRFEECEQGVHIVVPLTLQLARFRFLEQEVKNIIVRFLPSCFRKESLKK